MATCPKCGSHLTSTHQCRISRTRRAVEAGGMALGGGVTALVATAILDQTGQTAPYDGPILLAGAALALGVHYLVRKLG